MNIVVRTRQLLMGALLAALCSLSAPAQAAVPDGETAVDTAPSVEDVSPPVLWYFRRDNCPFCTRAETWLTPFLDNHPDVVLERIDIVRDPAGRAIFEAMLMERGEQAVAVPTFVLGDQVWVGFSSSIAVQIERTVSAALTGEAAEPVDREAVIDLGPFGEIELVGRSMLAATVLIALVDGFNPCSLWVLTVLLAMLVGTRSRKRIALVGGTFLLVTATAVP